MARRPSVTVQMAEDEAELDSIDQLIAAAQTPDPREPPDDEPQEPDEPEEPPEDEPQEDDDPLDLPDDGNTGDEIPPDEDDNGRLNRDMPADPPHTSSAAAPDTRPAAGVPLTGEILPGQLRYEARITIVDAYQYSGSVGDAPVWVDRNWVAYADHDPMRNIEPGPALRVPTYRGDDVYCRIGDYVARQEVKLLADQPGEIKIEVWTKEQFERLFIPVKSATSRAEAPPRSTAVKTARVPKVRSSRQGKSRKTAASAV